MAVGDELTFYWAINWDTNGGGKGFDFKASGTTVYTVLNGGSSTITAGGVNAGLHMVLMRQGYFS